MLLLTLGGCNRNAGLPKPGTPEYLNLVRAFYVGLAGLQTGEDVRAKEKLTLATQIAPGEPSSWANLGLLAVRQQNLDQAFEYAERARGLDPGNSRIEELLGQIESRRGKLPEAIAHLKKAIDLDPKNGKALFALAEETERQAGPSSDKDALQLFEKLLAQQPSNIAVLLAAARLDAKTNQTDSLKKVISTLQQQAGSWPDQAKDRVTALAQAAASSDSQATAVQVVYLRNVLARVPEYRRSSDAVKTPAAFVGDPFVAFLKIPSPSSEPAPADLALGFDSKSKQVKASWIGAIVLGSEQKPSLVTVDSKGVEIENSATLPASGVAMVLGADLNYDFKTDLVVAGASGVKLFEQQDPKHFIDVTAKAKLPADVLHHAYTGAWAFDVDLDGDLDVVLGAADGSPVVLRNNADGTFALVRPFAGVSGLTAFASADIDGDGDPDVALLDGAGKLHVFSNERLGAYRSRPLPANLSGKFTNIAAADINSDGLLDFVLLRDDGTLIRLSDAEAADIGKVNPGPHPVLHIADFDNNGSLDILAGDGEILLGSAKGFTALSTKAPLTSVALVDRNGDGRLDIVGLSADGSVVEAINHGQKNYGWQNLFTRAARVNGDQRINSFGIGGEIEIRSGLLTQKQIITSPLLHFGLGDHTETDVARIVWPNGGVQAEFELKANQQVLAEQRLKGSCPWLFAWDGKQMSFVKDGAPWSPALGLHINAQMVAGIGQTQEWFKIPGENLVPHDGYYDLRVTGELWETYYIDHYSLMVVDHPANTEIYTDERFSVPSPPLKIYTTQPAQPFASAKDDRGQDVSSIVRSTDRVYLDTFGRGPYQGLTRDHWVELELPANAPTSGPLYMLAEGWVHPTDATVNIAIGQSNIEQPKGLSIETITANGKWTAAKSGLGFPAGKLKTVVLDLTGVFHPGAPRKLRLRTNLEVYWDKLGWAAGAQGENRVQRLALSSADLRYRGFSIVTQANPSSPEIPDYNHLEGTAQKWRDLEGYATRLGDVRELLENIDDRIVIFNAGDELRLRFPELPAPAAGWKRDFVMIGDGWIKDGDYNSTYSKTVLPLPYHGMKDYTVPPGRLEDDTAYRMHPADWDLFHTRYITADAFRGALRQY